MADKIIVLHSKVKLLKI